MEQNAGVSGCRHTRVSMSIIGQFQFIERFPIPTNAVIPSEVEGSTHFFKYGSGKIPPRGFALVGMTRLVGICPGNYSFRFSKQKNTTSSKKCKKKIDLLAFFGYNTPE